MNEIIKSLTDAIERIGITKLAVIGGLGTVAYSAVDLKVQIWEAITGNPTIGLSIGGLIGVIVIIWLITLLQKQVVDGLHGGLKTRDDRIAKLDADNRDLQKQIIECRADCMSEIREFIKRIENRND